MQDKFQEELKVRFSSLTLQEYVPKLSKLEQEYMDKAKQRQKDGITKPQIVAGREFKGTSFISKPDKIIFKVTSFI